MGEGAGGSGTDDEGCSMTTQKLEAEAVRCIMWWESAKP